MDQVKQLYLTLDGRINRMPFWLGFLGLIVVSILLNLLVGIVTGGNAFSLSTTDPSQFLTGDPAEISATLQSALSASAWTSLVVTAIIAYPAFALMLKRAKDRDMNLRFIYVYWGLAGVNLLAQISGIAFTTTTIGQFTVPVPSTIGWALTLAQGLLGLFLLVVLGFLRGTVGGNQHGPDPLGGKSEEAQFDDAKLDG